MQRICTNVVLHNSDDTNAMKYDGDTLKKCLSPLRLVLGLRDKAHRDIWVVDEEATHLGGWRTNNQEFLFGCVPISCLLGLALENNEE